MIYPSASGMVYFTTHMKLSKVIGVPPVIIHFERWDFPMEINHPLVSNDGIFLNQQNYGDLQMIHCFFSIYSKS